VKMAIEKHMNESAFEKLVKELNSLGELIRTRQDEKQAVIDEFQKERARYKVGKLSENAVESSVRKTNKELIRLDKDIRRIISQASSLSLRIKNFVTNQNPKVFRAKVSGVASNKKAKKKAKKRSVKRKAEKATKAKKRPIKAKKK